MNLGRFQVGQPVTLSVSTFDRSGGPDMPDAAPMATITRPDHSTFAVKMAMDGGPTLFSIPIVPGIEFELGTYQVAYTYQVDGYNIATPDDAFDVIEGGDPGGRVISMTAYDRPEAQYVVVQLASGRIVQGRNPRL